MEQGQPSTDNCTDRNAYGGIVLLQMVLYIPVFTLGISLNSIAFWVFCCKIRRWTETKVYMINLIVADSFLIFTLPFLLYFTKYKHPVDGLCVAIQNICFTNMPMSILIITLIAVDRYIAIKFPLKAKILRSPLKSASICGFLWIILIIFSNFYGTLNRNQEGCCFQKESLQPRYSSVVYSIGGYFIPLGVVTFCSVQVIRCLKEKMATSPHETKLFQKAVHIVSVNLCVFAVCFSPFHFSLLLRFAVEAAGAHSLLPGVTTFVKVSACLANCNCCLDAFCYYFAAKEFPEFSSMFPKCVFMKSKTNQSEESQPSTNQVVA
ncbi:PREDICTED: G-protein coupled receptor 35-like [Sturnus vulgaris]|uniref:G-protein coupled receptor 35-like n=1 Tax=Sturnus vulgaris TaxID=9172 RepID=UPI00071A93C5|nr:PREDICTED: G-protein coupled receptor 35-like [Sturnus vulgaris]